MMDTRFISLDGKRPRVDPTTFVAPSAVLIGDVEIGPSASIWYGAVLRGDDCAIRIAADANVQDCTIIHGDFGNDVHVGAGATIGHRAILHGCRIGAGALVGMAAVVLDGALVDKEAMVGAGAVVAAGKQVKPRTLWLGCPAREIRALTDADLASMRDGTALYKDKAQTFDARMRVET